MNPQDILFARKLGGGATYKDYKFKERTDTMASAIRCPFIAVIDLPSSATYDGLYVEYFSSSASTKTVNMGYVKGDHTSSTTTSINNSTGAVGQTFKGLILHVKWMPEDDDYKAYLEQFLEEV